MISVSNLFEQMTLEQLQAARADLLKRKMGIPTPDGPRPHDHDSIGDEVGDSSEIMNSEKNHSIGMEAWSKGLKKAARAVND